MRAMQDEEYQELHEINEYMNERQAKLTSTMERNQKLMGEVVQLREHICQEILSLGLQEKKQAVKELLKERRKTKVEEWRDTVVAGSGVAREVAVGSRSSEAEGNLFLSEVEALREDMEENQKSFGHFEAPPQKRRAVIRKEQEYVSALPLMNHLGQNTEAEDEKNMEELSFVPSAVSEPRWTLHMCGKKCRAKGLKFVEIVAVVSDSRKRSAHGQLFQEVLQ